MNQEHHTHRTRDRAQTAQDFAVGIGLFLLAVAFVFAFVPQVVSPYDAGVGASESAQADRAATLIVGNLSVDDRPNELNHSAVEAFFDSDPSVGEFQNRTGLPFTARINVSVRNVTSESIQSGWSGGAQYRSSREAASASRIVRTTNGSCDPACRLVVRMW